MEITYKKITNTTLFKNFKNPDLLNMEECQNYIPIYNHFFTFNDNNYNSINLNSKNALNSLTEKVTENIFRGTFKNDDNKTEQSTVFFKLCPLLDPFKYLAGKYDILDPNLFNLPKINNNNCHTKICDINNSSYVDSFFTYLTSQLYNRLDFVHGIDFYGSFLGIKTDYHVDIGDDLDMMSSSEFFYENTNKLFKFINSEHEELLNEDSRKNKKPLNLGESINNDDVLDLVNTLDILDINSNNQESIIDLSSANILIYEDSELNKDTNNSSKKTDESSSECSSRSSKTENEEDENEKKEESSDDEEDEDEDDSSENSSDVETIFVSINRFPIQIIALENCSNTLDYLFVEDKLSPEELSCAVVQILMTLITYQKLFNLTHNDLHTNNIMYVETDKKYLYYKVNNRHYKIKTYGKIFKIIDFGRAIYKYKNKLIYSDSFSDEGDATTQYNCEPYFNKNKPRLEPNYSFDLCRLGCAICDFLDEQYDEDDTKYLPIHKIILNWCVDDDNRNILYKKNGEERYPDFKLYKMIARKVHNHIPMNELKNKYFDKYVVPKKEIRKGSKIWNIDTLEGDPLDTQNNSVPVLDACD